MPRRWVGLGCVWVSGFRDSDPDSDPAGSNPEPSLGTQTQKVSLVTQLPVLILDSLEGR